jgi:hypothetical protein
MHNRTVTSSAFTGTSGTLVALYSYRQNTSTVVIAAKFTFNGAMKMKKSLLVGMAIMLLITSTLSGCILVPVDDGYRGENHHERDRGGQRGEGHDRR